MRVFYTTEEAAKYLGVSQARVRQFIQEGRLASQKKGRDHIIESVALKHFAENGRRKTGRPKKRLA